MLKAVVAFVCFSVACVLLFTCVGPVTAAFAPLRPRRLLQMTHTFHARPQAFGSPPPPPQSAVGSAGSTGNMAAPRNPSPALSVALVRSVDVKGASDPGGAARIAEASPLIQGMIEAGFSRRQSVEALSAVSAKTTQDIRKAIEWSLRQGTDKNLMEYRQEREVVPFEKMDFDGYALLWGDKHRTSTLEECGKRCLEWKPQPPAHFACNVFVFCPLNKCFAPAALPPGSMTGQCWLKHQPDPNNPQVNMRGNYSAAYVKRHPGAPPHVQWQAGVVIRKGSNVDLSTWSARANW